MIKSNEKKYILKCVPNSPINSKIVDGYSDLGDGHFILKFKNDENRIEMHPTETDEEKNITNIYNRKSYKGLSTGGIIAIIISCCVVLLALTVLIFYQKKIVVNKNYETTKPSLEKINPQSITN